MNKDSIKLALALVGIILVIILIQNRSSLFSTNQEQTLGPVSSEVAGEIGDTAIDFALTDYNNDVRKLSDYAGTPVVLNFWASWCPFCTEELPDFNEAYQELSDDGRVFRLIAVNRGESLDRARSFTDPMNLQYDLLMNRADDVARAYNLRAMPSTYFINEEGVIVDIKRGPMDAEELKARIINNFNLGEEQEVVETIADALPPDLPDDLMVSTRTISLTDGVKHSVPLEDILAGGPPQDGIPSIDNPKFVSVQEANTFLDDEGLGIAVSFNGVDRFYPNQITVWHELVNDQIGDQAFLVSYCPLCAMGVVFEPLVNGQVTEFGTSGKLWNSNLVMYDRQTESYWSQVLGEAIVGEQTGTKLKLLPYQNVLYKDWKADHPNGEVLSDDTGFRRDYTRNPYEGYELTTNLFSRVDNTDDRYHPKSITFQIEVNNEIKIYPLEELLAGPQSFEDEFAGESLVVTFDPSDQTIDIRNKESGEEVVPFYGFWFSVIAVHPDAEVYTAQ